MSRAALRLLGVMGGLAALLWAADRPRPPAGPDLPPAFPDDPSLPEPAFARLAPAEYLGAAVALRFSPDGRYLAVGLRKPNPKYEWPAPQGVGVWDLRTRKFLRYMPDLEPGDIAFSPDSSVLAVCRNTSRSGNDPWPIQMFLTDPATGREVGRLRFGTHLIFLEFARDGRRLYYSIAGPVRLHDVDWRTGAGGPLYPDLDPHLAPFFIDYCERTRTVACTLYGGGGCVFQADTSNPVRLLPGAIPEGSRVELAPDGRTAAVFGDTPLRCFRAPSGEPIPVPATSQVKRCEFSPDGRYLAYMTEVGSRVHCLDPRTGKFAASLACANDGLESLAFSPDGSVLATGTGDGSVLLWNLRGPKSPRFEYATETGAAASKYYVPDQDTSRAVPAGARVALKTAKSRYLLGEEIFVQFELSNVGRRPFTFTTGGDYRFAPRHLRYSVEAIHADGTPAADPHPNPNCFGGLMGGQDLVPGQSHTETLDLLAYCRIDRPGRYRVRASHDFGWSGGGRPVGETTIEVAEPTPEEARALVERVQAAEARAKADNPNVTGLTAWHRITHPAYLPLLAERARAGSRGAVEALGQMPDPGATRALIELLDRPDPGFVADVEQALYYRLPDPELEDRLHRRNFFDPDDSDPRKYLRDKSWRPEFAPAVRAHGRWLLGRVDEKRLWRGAFLIGCAGTPDDLPAVLAGFDTAVEAAQGRPVPDEHYPRAPAACAELRRAIDMLIDRGAGAPAGPKTPGEKLLFVEAVARRPDFRPAGWVATFVGILRDRLDYLREAAVQAVPDWCPKAIRQEVPELLRDRHVDVQIAALHLAERLAMPEWKPAVIEAFAKAHDEWQLRAADNALYRLCPPLERIEVHIAKMGDPDPKMASEAVEMLDHAIFHDASGGSNGIKLDTPEKRRACQETWRAFVAANRDKLKRRAPFSLLDDVPRDALFPGYKFSMPRRRSGEDE